MSRDNYNSTLKNVIISLLINFVHICRILINICINYIFFIILNTCY